MEDNKKSEKQKMLSGESYDCADAELLTRWHRAKALQQKYNNTLSTDIIAQIGILDKLLGSHGENVWISAPFFVDYGENIYLGKNGPIRYSPWMTFTLATQISCSNDT